MRFGGAWDWPALFSSLVLGSHKNVLETILRLALLRTWDPERLVGFKLQAVRAAQHEVMGEETTLVRD